MNDNNDQYGGSLNAYVKGLDGEFRAMFDNPFTTNSQESMANKLDEYMRLARWSKNLAGFDFKIKAVAIYGDQVETFEWSVADAG